MSRTGSTGVNAPPAAGPSPVLETPRLTLRYPREGDLADALEIFSDPQVVRYWSSPAWTGMDDARAWLARTEAYLAQGDARIFAVQHKPDGRMIGTCTVFQIHRDARRAEIGYALGSAWWGRGLMHEALHALVTHAFESLDLRRLEADIDPDNAASRRALERLGFRLEGRLRERWEVDGAITDSEIYGLLRREWPPQTP